jgi:hypothetical protein
MDQDRRNGGNTSNKMDTPMTFDYKTGTGPSNSPIFATNNWNTNRMVPEHSVLGGSGGDLTTNRSVQNVNGTGGLQTLPVENHGHSHVTTPSPYSGKKEDFHGFRWELGLYLTANRKDFQNDESMVIFALSYMKIGAAAKWADAFVEKALEEDDWGSYIDFLDQLTRDFSDKEEPRKALEEMGCLYQGKGMASDYFQKMEQLTSVAGIDIDRTPHILLQMEKGLNSVLIDQLYFSGSHLENYHDYKRRIVDADNMRKRQEANKKRVPTPSTPRMRNVNDMDVDKTKTHNEACKCYGCNEAGHLARNCLKKEKRQDFEIGLYCRLYTPW